MKQQSPRINRMRILDNHWQVGGEGLTGSSDAAVYRVHFGREAALIDSGCGEGHAQSTEKFSNCLQTG